MVLGWERGEDGNGEGGGWVLVVWPPGEGVRLAVGCPLSVDYVVLVRSQGCRPPGMSSGCSPACRKVLEVLVIGEDLDWMLGSFDVDSPMLEPGYHREQLFIVDGVVHFGWGQLPGVVAHRVHVAFWGGLGQDAADGEVGGVRLDGDGQVGLEVFEDGSGGEGLLQLLEGCTGLLCPGELALGFAGKIGEGGCQNRVTINKLSTEIGKAQK